MVQNSQPNGNEDSQRFETDECKIKRCLNLRNQLLDDIKSGNLTDKEKLFVNDVLQFFASFVSRINIMLDFGELENARGASMVFALKFLVSEEFVRFADMAVLRDFSNTLQEYSKFQMGDIAKKNTELEN